MAAHNGNDGGESWSSRWLKVESEMTKIMAKECADKIQNGEMAVEAVEDLIKWYPEVLR